MAICGTRAEAEALMSADPRRVYPSDYRVYLPRQPSKRVIHDYARAGMPIWPMFHATAQGRRLAQEYLAREARGRRPIVITLRNYDYTPERNSLNAEWIAFADGLDRERYAAIFIPDAETVMREPPADFSRHIVCDAASVNLEFRMALYEAAWLNMALMHGPLELCWYNELVRYLFFNGHQIGVDLNFATPCQRIVWERDELPVLRREFQRMEQLLEEADRKRATERTDRTGSANGAQASQPGVLG
jgi:hypothetical protein